MLEVLSVMADSRDIRESGMTAREAENIIKGTFSAELYSYRKESGNILAVTNRDEKDINPERNLIGETWLESDEGRILKVRFSAKIMDEE